MREGLAKEMFVSNVDNLHSSSLSLSQKIIKRSFDLLASTIGLLLIGWIMLIAAFLAWMNTGKSGFFRQERVGLQGKRFKVIKIRTMKDIQGFETTVTTKDDPRITLLGKLLRRTKLDELPQLINVFIGDMSLVGPRPDVPGFADLLDGADRIVLSVRPGITGPASLKYRDEEQLLASQEDPEGYNREILFKDKVKINREYVEEYSLTKDIRYIWETIFH